MKLISRRTTHQLLELLQGRAQLLLVPSLVLVVNLIDLPLQPFMLCPVVCGEPGTMPLKVVSNSSSGIV
jgi:hypothetical protein